MYYVVRKLPQSDRVAQKSLTLTLFLDSHT